MRFGLEKPVFRIVVNTFGTLGTTGYTTGVMPSMTLGSVAWAARSPAITSPSTICITSRSWPMKSAPRRMQPLRPAPPMTRPEALVHRRSILVACLLSPSQLNGCAGGRDCEESVVGVEEIIRVERR